MKFLKSLLRLLEPFHSEMVLLLVLIFGFEIIKLANPYIFKEIIDALLTFHPEQVSYIGWLLVALLVVDIGGSLIYRKIDSRRFHFLLGVTRYLPELAHQKLIALSLGYHQRENTGNKIIKISRGVDKIDQLLGSAVWDLFPTTFQFLVSFGFIFAVNWSLALVFAIAIPPYVWLTFRMSRRTLPLRVRERHFEEESSGVLGQSIINIKTVQSFSQEQFEVSRNVALLDQWHATRQRIWKMILDSNFYRNTVLDLGRVMTLAFGAYQTYTGQITPGSLVLFITLSEKVYTSMYRLSRVYERVVDSTEGIARLSALLDEEPEIQSTPSAKRLALRGGISFQQVSFSYRDGVDALRDVSFEIQPGETIALVGPSGSGKSTLVNLLYRHYDVTGGAIKIDGVNVKELELFGYRRQLGIVAQDIDIFNDTVAKNISYAVPDATLEQIRAAAELANADEFIDALPNGYETLVGERGVKLSGGQRQRIGIARAILLEPKILVFDEATSQLDSLSERLIQQSLSQLRGRCTLIVIAHRLSTVRSADRIYVFDRGGLVEQGSHQELGKSGGLYARLHQLQMSGDLTE